MLKSTVPDSICAGQSWTSTSKSLALVAGVFGTRAWIARELARVAGRARSPAKAAAARSNGAEGAAAQGGEGSIITCCTRSRWSTAAQKARLARGE